MDKACYALHLNPKRLGEVLGLSTAEVYHVYQDAAHIRALAASWLLNLYGEKCRLYILNRKGLEVPKVTLDRSPLVVVDIVNFPSVYFVPVDIAKFPSAGKHVSWTRFYDDVLGTGFGLVQWQNIEVGE